MTIFSIIVPTFNRPEKLKTCIKSFTALNHSKNNFEVIIVDDGGSTPLIQIIELYKKRLNIRLIKLENSGPASARNAGVKIAKGKFLVFTDDDCQIDPNYLNCLTNANNRLPDSVFVGKTLNLIKNNVYSEASQLSTTFLRTFFLKAGIPGNILVSNNFSLAKSTFLKVGGFDRAFSRAGGEDREFGYRLSTVFDTKIIYDPELKIWHAHEMGLSQFFNQHYNYGRGTVLFYAIINDYKNTQKRINPLEFYIKLLLFPFQFKLEWRAFTLSFLLALSQIIYAIGYLAEKFSYRKIKSKFSSKTIFFFIIQ